MTEENEEIFLNDTWALYFHDPYDEKWDKNSYKLLATISTIDDLIKIQQAFHEIWAKGMFFLMREHIMPLWEDEQNRNGGCFSYKIMKPEVPKSWYELCAMALGETLTKIHKENWNKITGISVSPKRSYCILRIWISDKSIADISQLSIKLPNYTDMLFKSHEENKDYEQIKSH